MIEGLYLITDGAERLLERVEEALRGGVRVLQYREKLRPPGERLEMAKALRALCHRSGVTFIINDDPQLAREVGADGVHLGQSDMPIVQARETLGGGIIGISTRTVEQARAAQDRGADYIGLGSLYPTATKSDAELVGLNRLREVRAAVDLPIVGIGGISADSAAGAIDAGADALAVVSAVMGDPDPALAAREIALAFNRRAPFPRGRVMTIAGSDSGGGAGIQADLKTITLLGGFGTSAITALTAQNTLGVQGIHPVAPDFVTAQIDSVLADIGTDTVKTGMLFSAQIVREVARALERHGLLAVVDPVMIAKGGSSLLQQEAVDALRQELLPRTFLLTPNLPEAEALAGQPVRDETEMERAARLLQGMGARHVLIKGGHLKTDAVDLLLAADRVHRFPAQRVDTPNTHGTGCTYAAALATFLAQGEPLVTAVARAKAFIAEAIRTAIPTGAGHGPVNHWEAAKKITNAGLGTGG